MDVFKGFPDEDSIVNYTLSQAYQDNVSVFASQSLLSRQPFVDTRSRKCLTPLSPLPPLHYSCSLLLFLLPAPPPSLLLLSQVSSSTPVVTVLFLLT